MFKYQMTLGTDSYCLETIEFHVLNMLNVVSLEKGYSCLSMFLSGSSHNEILLK